MAEYGVVAPQGRSGFGQLAGVIEDGDSGLPAAVVELGGLLLGRIVELDEKIDGLDRELRTSARECEEAARPMTIPGIGPVTAMAIQAFAPPMESFQRGRDFSAWLGLVSRQHTTGGKPKLGRISKMGQRDLRRLLVTGAMTVVRHAIRYDGDTDPWLAGMLARKPKKVVAVALANRMARRVWAPTTRRDRKNQPWVKGLRARLHDLEPISRTPYGPAATQRHIERPDIRQHLATLPPTRF